MFYIDFEVDNGICDEEFHITKTGLTSESSESKDGEYPLETLLLNNLQKQGQNT